MKLSLKNAIALSLIPQIFLVKWLGNYPEFIESYYSQGLYPFFSKMFRTLFGWVPFSIGDIIYALLIFLAVRYLIVRRKKIRQHTLGFFRDVLMVLSIAYFTFYLVWGLNYYRQPIDTYFDLKDTYTHAELVELTEKLIDKTNGIQFQITSDSLAAVKIPYTKKDIFDLTEMGYTNLEKKFPRFKYQKPSVKASLFSTGLTYMGYGGYLNPFTNEAQVNGKLPAFRHPFVASHEVGHQIGYSAENETNFIGYLAATSHDDLYFQYSAYAYVLGYCLSSVQLEDEATFNKLYRRLNPGILKNYKEVSDFWESHENPMEPVFKAIFDSFLKANDQADGIQSYSRVVALLVNYHKKYPLE